MIDTTLLVSFLAIFSQYFYLLKQKVFISNTKEKHTVKSNTPQSQSLISSFTLCFFYVYIICLLTLFIVCYFSIKATIFNAVWYMSIFLSKTFFLYDIFFWMICIAWCIVFGISAIIFGGWFDCLLMKTVSVRFVGLVILINNCNLCLSEKVFIIRNLDDVNMLNNRSEFISKCRHINKKLLNRVKDHSNDWLYKSTFKISFS